MGNKIKRFFINAMLLAILLAFGMPSNSQSMDCNYSAGDSGKVIANEACVYTKMFDYASTDTLAKQLIGKICELVYLKPHFAVQPCSNIKTARAFIYDDNTRYIFFDPAFIDSIVKKKGNEWNLIGVLAHEIAHHLDGHTMRKADKDEHRRAELEADEFSGAILARMGATAEQAVGPLLTVRHPLCDYERDEAYPCLEKRREAVMKGYDAVPRKEVKKNFLLNNHLEKIDISSFGYSPVRNQGSDATCVGFTLAYAIEHELNRTKNDSVLISARYIYNKAGGRPNTGVYMDIALDVLVKFGAISEKDWPYVADDYDSLKLKQADLVQKRYFVKRFNKLPINADMFIAVLEQGHHVIAGIKVFPNFLSRDYIWKVDPLEATNIVERKSTVIVGYDPKTQFFKFKNTWGTGWGENGYGYFSITDLNKLIDEAYFIEL